MTLDRFGSVSGYVSAKIDEGLPSETNVTSVTINGVTATLSGVDTNGNVAFTNSVPLSPGPGPTAITGQITWSDGRVTDLPPGYQDDYEVVSRHTATENISSGEGFGASLTADSGCGTDWLTSMFREWSSRDAVLTQSPLFSVSTTNQDSYSPECSTDVTPESNDWWIASGPPDTDTSLAFGPESRALSLGVSYKSVDDKTGYALTPIYPTAPDGSASGVYNPCDDPNVGHPGCPDGWTPVANSCACDNFTVLGHQQTDDFEEITYERTRNEGSLTFRAPWHYATNTPVIFTFTNTSYTTLGNATVDLTNVQFIFDGRTNDPVAVDNTQGTVSYGITVDGGKRYDLTEANFIWPSFSTNYAYSATDLIGDYYFHYEGTNTVTVHHLAFAGFHNATPVLLLIYKLPTDDGIIDWTWVINELNKKSKNLAVKLVTTEPPNWQRGDMTNYKIKGLYKYEGTNYTRMWGMEAEAKSSGGMVEAGLGHGGDWSATVYSDNVELHYDNEWQWCPDCLSGQTKAANIAGWESVAIMHEMHHAVGLTHPDPFNTIQNNVGQLFLNKEGSYKWMKKKYIDNVREKFLNALKVPE